ncbi:MAG TPA: protein kinase [Ktedonobacterales bacterium]
MAGLEGKIIGGCRIIRQLGGGGMGEVFLAEQVSLKRQVAIKLVRPEVEAAAAGGASLMERFAREAQAIAAMEHPHILPVYDFGEQDGLAYLVMAYAPNGSLQQALTPGHPAFRFGLPLSLDLAGVMLDQAAQALQHAHDRGVLHRDVKPANFLMGAGPPGTVHLLLADFGLAKFTSGAANSAVYSGTAAYSAPEQIQRQALPASDQYSLAAMLYLLLTGRLPFQGGLLEIVSQQLASPVPALRGVNPTIPAEVDEVILRALAKRPEDRWPSVIVFAAAYREACARARGSTAALPASAPGQPAPGQPGAPQIIGLVMPAAPPAGGQVSPPLAATAPLLRQAVPPDAGATQVAPPMPSGGAFAPPARQTTVQGQSGDDSFVAAGPLPLPPVLPPRRRRRAWGGWAALAGGVGVIVALILIVSLVNGRLGGNQQSNIPGNNIPPPGITPPPGGTVPVGVPGVHIKSIQAGLDIHGDLGKDCQNFQIVQPTTNFRQQDQSIWVVFTAVNDGNPNAQADAALIDSHHNVVKTDIPATIDCTGTAPYPALLDISNVPPGQYAIGVFYSETDTIPQQPEMVIPVTISA